MNPLYTDTRPTKEAIGYVRVSTEMQADDGRSLERQLQKLRDWCEVNGYRMTSIYQDVASAVGEQNLRRRPEFEQAVREAVAANVPLVVSDVSRVSRDLGTLERLVVGTGLQVISVVDDGDIPVGVLRERVMKASYDARRIAEGTREALSRIERVKKPSIRKARQRAAQESVKVRVNKKFLILDQVVDFLEANPKLMQDSSGVIADRLNAVGILTNWGRTWTASSVRGKMREINEELLFRREMREDEAIGESGTESSNQVLYDQLPEIDCRDAIVPVAADVPVSGIDAEPSGPIAEMIEEEREYAEMKRQPTFGMF